MNKTIKFLCWIAVIVILSAQMTSAAGEETLTKPDGSKYVGEWQDRKRHGQGTFTFPDGGKYVGGWQDNKMHGQGTETLPSGSKYVGEWKDDKWRGQGTLTWPDGRKYVGEFRDNKPWNGTLYDKGGNALITFVNGVEKSR